jgi:uncharacterized protein (DUF849 family)
MSHATPGAALPGQPRSGRPRWELTACLNGSRRPGAHPRLPGTPEELAADARACVEAGAAAVHIHPRGRDGRESLDAADVAAAVAATRAAVPGTPISVTTGLWVCAGDAGRRLARLRAWAELTAAERPESASLNVCEPGFAAAHRALRAAGVAVEAGVWSRADAAALVASGRRDDTERVLLEVIDVAADRAEAYALDLVEAVCGLDAGTVLLHGERDATWPVLELAARLGLPGRIGLEDTLLLPTGRPAADNPTLIRAALDRAAHTDRAGGTGGTG